MEKIKTHFVFNKNYGGNQNAFCVKEIKTHFVFSKSFPKIMLLVR